jgi:hypothetical protein
MSPPAMTTVEERTQTHLFEIFHSELLVRAKFWISRDFLRRKGREGGSRSPQRRDSELQRFGTKTEVRSLLIVVKTERMILGC